MTHACELPWGEYIRRAYDSWVGISSVQSAHQRYNRAYLEQMRKDKADDERVLKCKREEEVIDGLRKKTKLLEGDIKSLNSASDDLATQATKSIKSDEITDEVMKLESEIRELGRQKWYITVFNQVSFSRNTVAVTFCVLTVNELYLFVMFYILYKHVIFALEFSAFCNAWLNYVTIYTILWLKIIEIKSQC